MKKTIAIFANSVKHNNHCVAGKCIETKKWIRPVGDEDGKALTKEQVKYKNNYGVFLVKPKQKIKMEFDKSTPLCNQPENYLIKSDYRWEQAFSLKDEELKNYVDEPFDLWGESNRVKFKDIKDKKITISQSLYLIKVDKIKLYKEFNTFKPESPKRKVNFEYNKIIYELSVTDPNFDELIEKKEEVTLNDKYLCISLGENYEDYCYKLVAAIL